MNLEGNFHPLSSLLWCCRGLLCVLHIWTCSYTICLDSCVFNLFGKGDLWKETSFWVLFVPPDLLSRPSLLQHLKRFNENLLKMFWNMEASRTFFKRVSAKLAYILAFVAFLNWVGMWVPEERSQRGGAPPAHGGRRKGQPECRSWAETRGQVMGLLEVSDQGSSWAGPGLRRLKERCQKIWLLGCHSAKGVRLKASVFLVRKRLSLLLFKRRQ